MRDISIAVGVMSVPERKDMLDQLLGDLGPGIDCVHVDRKRAGPTPTWLDLLGCLLQRPEPATHVLTLEDDAVLSRDFLATATNCLEAQPTVPVAFCTVLRYERPSPVQGWALYERKWRCNVAIALPRLWAIDFWAWTCRPETHDEVGGKYYDAPDALLSHYLTKVVKEPMWATIPQLVDHGGSGKSTVGHTGNWRAPNFIGADVSGGGYEW